MTALRRRLANLMCDLIDKLLPSCTHHWGHAIRNEVAAIDDDSKALHFATCSLFGLVPRALLFRVLRPIASMAEDAPRPSGDPSAMNILDNALSTPRSVGIVCAIAATLLGCFYMIMGAAPWAYLAINLGALVIGLLTLALLSLSAFPLAISRSATILILGLTLLATSVMGVEAEGVSRWIKLGPLVIQPSLVVLPMMIIGFAQTRDRLSTLGMIIAAIAIAVQPDRAMAGALMAGMIALNALRRDSFTMTAALSSVGAFVITMARPDASPAMPFVDQIIYLSFDVHAIAGIAVVGGLSLLVLPAVAGVRFENDIRTASLVFGAVWTAIIIAAALGNYPTPLVGYSGSAVLGYVLSLAMLPKLRQLDKDSKDRCFENEHRESQIGQGRMMATI